jgi:hypothetical protein
MNLVLKFTTIGISIAFLSISYTKQKFNTQGSDFQHIHNELTSNGHETAVKMDTEVHSYTFNLNENKVITSIGYQKHQDLGSTNYLIEIISMSDSITIYSQGHQFGTNNLNYINPTFPILLESGKAYTISRIQTNWGQYITETIGHIVKTAPSDYPLNHGPLTILETNFNDFGSVNPSLKNYALPRIDIVLE